MIKLLATTLLTALLAICCFGAQASDIVCVHPDDPNHTFTVEGVRGVYTWDDHGIERSRELSCHAQNDNSTACHHWGQIGEVGRSVLIYKILRDGTLVEAGVWALLNVSRVVATPGFVCRK
ncbi:hypothetical protein LP7551_01426 [Roseibium album]|nr:hypothetical protein LP7551_01426 [Roseibium album]